MRVLAANDWILALPPGAGEYHAIETHLALSQISGNSSDAGSDTRPKRGGIVNGVLKNRPIIRDIANSLS